jgi:hypothetical protein
MPAEKPRLSVTMVCRDRYLCLLLSILLLSLLGSGCANHISSQNPQAPSWLNGRAESFPAQRYVVGKGKAVALDVAAKRARDRLLQRLTEEEGPLPATVDGALRAASEVVDAWFDPDRQRHYALVAIKRTKVAEILRHE